MNRHILTFFVICAQCGLSVAGDKEIKSFAAKALAINNDSISFAKSELGLVSQGRSQSLARQELAVSILRDASKAKAGSKLCIEGLGCFVVNEKNRKSIHSKMIVAQAVLVGMRSKEEQRIRLAIEKAESLEEPFLPGLLEKRETIADGDWGVFDRDVTFVKYIGEGFHAQISGQSSSIVLLSGWRTDEILVSNDGPQEFQDGSRAFGRLPGICVAEEKEGVVVVRKICSVPDFIQEMKKVSNVTDKIQVIQKQTK